MRVLYLFAALSSYRQALTLDPDNPTLLIGWEGHFPAGNVLLRSLTTPLLAPERPPPGPGSDIPEPKMSFADV